MADTVTIRLAAPADVAGCMRLEHTLTPDEVLHKMSHDEIFVALCGDQVIGYLRVGYLWGRVPCIDLIRLLPDHQGQGIGRQMLGVLEDELRQRGCRMLLSSSTANEARPQAWRHPTGFVECGILAGVNEGGVGEIFFRKTLIEG